MQKINKIILSTDDNPNYIEFTKITCRAFIKLLGIKPTLGYLTNKPKSEWEGLENVAEVIQFKPDARIPRGNNAKVLRIILASMYPNDICMLGDIDLLPL